MKAELQVPFNWTVRRIKDVALINPSRPRVQNTNMLVSFIRMHGVSEDARITGDERRPYSEVASGYTSFQNDDVLVAKITPCFENGKGALAGNLVNGIGLGSTEFHVLRAKPGFDSTFLYYLTLSPTFRGRGEMNMQGSAGQKRVPTDFLRSYRFPCPPLPEQRKIAEILGTWDEAIALTEQLIATKQQLKKGLMRQLLTGKRRFKEFEGQAWRETHIEEIAEVIMGQSPSSAHYNHEGNGLPLIQGNADIANRRTRPRAYSTEITKCCRTGDIILSVRAPVGDIALSVHEACIGRGVCAIRSRLVDAGFLYQLLVSLEGAWRRYAQGSTFTAINSKDIRRLNVVVPESTEEQRKIAAVLQACDEEMGLLAHKLEAMQRQKKGLMQQLLTGRVRVKI